MIAVVLRFLAIVFVAGFVVYFAQAHLSLQDRVNKLQEQVATLLDARAADTVALSERDAQIVAAEKIAGEKQNALEALDGNRDTLSDMEFVEQLVRVCKGTQDCPPRTANGIVR